jgi:exodeoxyribonuclease VII small subunit
MSSSKNKTKDGDSSIESTMKSIEKLLEKLENSETSLNDSLQAFEQGISLIRSAQTMLSDAEQKIQVLVEQEGEPADIGLDPANESR